MCEDKLEESRMARNEGNAQLQKNVMLELNN